METLQSITAAKDEQRDDMSPVDPTQCPRNTTHYSKGSDFTIIWQNLTYKVDTRHWYTKLRERVFGASMQPNPDLDDRGESDAQCHRGERTILDGICGEIRSRQLTGILGPSGAGKSSFLHCLFQNRTTGVTGRILVDTNNKKRLKVCFIPQKDSLNDWLTVREDLIFVSKLRSERVDIPCEGSGTNSEKEQQQTIEASTYVKQSGTTTLIDHEENALRVADLLGITNCLDVLIKDISGGQKKRLSMARELMSKPDILILDEPTTGLDSLTCEKTIAVLRDLARLSTHPMAVVVTIHQPQRCVFNQFDRTYFLSNRGRVVYDGPPQSVLETLKDVANQSLSSAEHNPASTLIEISSGSAKHHILELLSYHQQTKFYERYDSQRIKKLMHIHDRHWNTDNEGLSTQSAELATSWQPKTDDQNTSSYLSNRTTTVSASCADGGSSLSLHEDYFISRQLKDCLASHKDKGFMRFIRHSLILTHRTWLSVIRNSTLLRSRLMFHASLPLIMLLIFGTTSGGPNGCPDIESELSLSDMRKSLKDSVIKKNVDDARLSMENVSFFCILMYGFGVNIISTAASHYPLTINMFKKETINGLYSPGPYFIGQMIADLPFELFFPSVSVILAYSLSGQIASHLEWRMIAVTLQIFLLCYAIHSFGLLFGSIFVVDINVAILVGQLTLFPAIVLSGFIIRSPRMPKWMQLTANLSVFHHALKGFVASRYGFNVCDCDEEMIPGDGSSVGFKGIPSNVKHVLEYMFPQNESEGYAVTDIFDKLSGQFIKAQTYSNNITSCEDVRPYIMKAFDVEDSDLLIGTIKLLIMIAVLKIATFLIMRVSPYRT